MRLHHMIECVSAKEAAGIARPSSKFKESNPDKMPSEIMRTWCGEPTFEFGDANAISESVGSSMVEYANELARNGMFHLPFQKTIISFNASNIAYVTVCAEENDEIIFFSIFAADADKRFSSHAKVVITRDANGILLKGISCGIIPGYTKEIKEQIAHFMQDIFPTWIVGLLAMLNAKGIEQRVTPAPKNLNKKRVAAGKPPIGEVREIFVRVGGVSYRASGDAESGHYRSPRLHWRRGHVRRLASGELTHVRPCLVGNRVGDETPDYKNYRVLA